MKEAGFSEDIRPLGGIDLPTMQKHINLWFSLCLDLFGGEISTNAAAYFATGLKGRAEEAKYDDHALTETAYEMELVRDGEVKTSRRADAQRDERGAARLVRRGLPARRRSVEQDPRAARPVRSPPPAGPQVQSRHRPVRRACTSTRTAGCLPTRNGRAASHEWLPGAGRQGVPAFHHERSRSTRPASSRTTSRRRPAASRASR